MVRTADRNRRTAAAVPVTMDYGTSGTEMGTAANQALDATAPQVPSAFGISTSAA